FYIQNAVLPMILLTDADGKGKANGSTKKNRVRLARFFCAHNANVHKKTATRISGHYLSAFCLFL
ncbi:MAG: hypothetical protein LOD92_05360, partial [Bacillales bacterium]